MVFTFVVGEAGVVRILDIGGAGKVKLTCQVHRRGRRVSVPWHLIYCILDAIARGSPAFDG